MDKKVGKKQKLLKLIDYLKLPMTPKEAKEHVEKLNDEEVELLTSTYEDIKNYQNSIDEGLREIDPKKHTEIEEQYQEKLTKLEDEYGQKMEKIQEEEDLELDAIEAEASRKIDEVVEKQESDLNEIEEAHKDLYSKLNTAVSSEHSTPSK